MMLTEASETFHVGIIMDGNGRYASSRGLPVYMGHRLGVESLKSIIRISPNLNITHLTVFSFSTENWGRSQEEVSNLIELLKEYFTSELDDLYENNVKIRVIGNLKKFDREVHKIVEYAVDKTSSNSGLNLNIALSYSGKEEIIDATKKIATYVLHGAINLDQIDDKLFSDFLYYPNMPNVDMLIRTGGEKRISNFMLWQIAYAELFFTDTMWPEFKQEEFEDIVNQFKIRQRRFGKRIIEKGNINE